MAKILFAVLLCLLGIPIISGTCYEESISIEGENFLFENFQDWEGLLGISYTYGQPQEHETVFEYLHRLHQKYEDISDFFARWMGNSEYKKFSTKYKAKLVLRTLANEVIPKLINKLGPKLLAKQLGKSTKIFLSVFHRATINPIGIAADIAQLILEHYFCAEELGSWVGFTGNIVGGAVSGYFLAGPFGAVAGGVVGYGVWKFGEVAAPIHVEWLEKLVKYL